jgi:hypothetical protein
MAEKIPASPRSRSRRARRHGSDPTGIAVIDRRARPPMPPSGSYEGRQGSLTLRRALAAAAALGWASTGGAPAGLTAAASAESPSPSPRLACERLDDPLPEGGDGGRKGLFIVGFSALVSVLLFVMGGDEADEADVEDEGGDPPIRL